MEYNYLPLSLILASGITLLICCVACVDGSVHLKFVLLGIMMTSLNVIFSALLAICAGNSPVPGEFPAQRPVTRSFDVFFDLRLNKRLSKQSWGWWFETLSRPLWRHCNDVALVVITYRYTCKLTKPWQVIWRSATGWYVTFIGNWFSN